MKLIQLADYGFKAIELQEKGTSLEDMFERLIMALKSIPELKDLSSYQNILKEKDVLDTVGVVDEINQEAKKHGFCLVFL